MVIMEMRLHSHEGGRVAENAFSVNELVHRTAIAISSASSLQAEVNCDSRR